jgi:hypothetical protein
MADVVNLNRYRKQRARDADRKAAAENRRRFGRTKSDLAKTRREAEKAEKNLDDKRLE